MKRVRRRVGSGALAAGLFTAFLSAGPTAAAAQTPGSIVGVVGGWVTNEQVWRSEYDTESVDGLQLGGFLNAATPVSWFRMRAEFMWTQRGGTVSGDLNGEPLIGETVPLPEELAEILARPSRAVSIDPDLDAVATAMDEYFP